MTKETKIFQENIKGPVDIIFSNVSFIKDNLPRVAENILVNNDSEIHLTFTEQYEKSVVNSKILLSFLYSSYSTYLIKNIKLKRELNSILLEFKIINIKVIHFMFKLRAVEEETLKTNNVPAILDSLKEIKKNILVEFLQWETIFRSFVSRDNNWILPKTRARLLELCQLLLGIL